MLFGSEEHVASWCRRRGVTEGAILPVETCWKLGELWYRDRLDEDWRPKPVARMQEIFAELELPAGPGEFWDVS